MNTADDVRCDIEVATDEPDYAAVNTLWLALLKLTNLQSGASEKARMAALVRQIPANEAREIVSHPAVDALLNLDPPLGTVLVNSHERTDPERTQRALREIRANRVGDPTSALLSLGRLLKDIRNTREHGFKTRRGARDAAILGAARNILEAICRSTLAHATAPSPPLDGGRPRGEGPDETASKFR